MIQQNSTSYNKSKEKRINNKNTTTQDLNWESSEEFGPNSMQKLPIPVVPDLNNALRQKPQDGTATLASKETNVMQTTMPLYLAKHSDDNYLVKSSKTTQNEVVYKDSSNNRNEIKENKNNKLFLTHSDQRHTILSDTLKTLNNITTSTVNRILISKQKLTDVQGFLVSTSNNTFRQITNTELQVQSKNALGKNNDNLSKSISISMERKHNYDEKAKENATKSFYFIERNQKSKQNIWRNPKGISSQGPVALFSPGKQKGSIESFANDVTIVSQKQNSAGHFNNSPPITKESSDTTINENANLDNNNTIFLYVDNNNITLSQVASKKSYNNLAESENMGKKQHAQNNAFSKQSHAFSMANPCIWQAKPCIL